MGLLSTFIYRSSLKKGNKYITVEKAQKMVRQLKELGITSEIPKSTEPLSTIKPMYMPYNGFLPTNRRFKHKTTK